MHNSISETNQSLINFQDLTPKTVVRPTTAKPTQRPTQIGTSSEHLQTAEMTKVTILKLINYTNFNQIETVFNKNCDFREKLKPVYIFLKLAIFLFFKSNSDFPS